VELIVCFLTPIVLFFTLVFCIVLRRKGYVRAGLRLPFAAVFVETTDSGQPVRPGPPKIQG
jgi:hypothetical protein